MCLGLLAYREYRPLAICETTEHVTALAFPQCVCKQVQLVICYMVLGNVGQIRFAPPELCMSNCDLDFWFLQKYATCITPCGNVMCNVNKCFHRK